jgi:hypothetical protein
LPPHCRTQAILGLGDADIPSVEFSTIEFFDGFSNRRLVRKPDKSEPPRTTGDPVDRQKHLNNVSHLRKEAGEFALGSVKTEVSDKDF